MTQEMKKSALMQELGHHLDSLKETAVVQGADAVKRRKLIDDLYELESKLHRQLFVRGWQLTKFERLKQELKDIDKAIRRADERMRDERMNIITLFARKEGDAEQPV